MKSVMVQRHVAIYSHEWGFNDGIPLFNGGLGVLNGCLALSFADLGYKNVVLVGVNYHKGLLRQEIRDNRQISHPADWDPEEQGYERLSHKVRVKLYGVDLLLGAWRKEIRSDISGESIGHILLDANEEQNPGHATEWTARLYSDRFKLNQNLILGLGGPAMLEALGYDVGTHHIQEGAAAFVALYLLNQHDWNSDKVRERCVFTNHTIVGAGMPTFGYDNVWKAVGYLLPSYDAVSKLAGKDGFDTNLLAANLSRYINGVSRLHAKAMGGTSQFAGRDIDYITNGVHWRFMSKGVQDLLDEKINGNWRLSPELLSQAATINPGLMEAVHSGSKKTLIDLVNEHGIRTDNFETDNFTVVYGKRITEYKLPDYLLKSVMRIPNLPAPIQIVYAGKAHRNDEGAHRILEEILALGLNQKGPIKFAFLSDYGISSGKILTAGADLWVVTAEPMLEASGTSPFKAGMNGIKTLSRNGGAWPEIIESYEENGYTFAERDGTFSNVFMKALHDFMDGKMQSDMLRIVGEFGSRFNAIRMAKEYGNVYESAPSKLLEERVEALA